MGNIRLTHIKKMLIHLFICILAIATIFLVIALTHNNRVLSLLSSSLWFSLGMLVTDLEFIWINDVGTVITYHWATEAYMMWVFWGLGMIMLVIGFFQFLGYTASSFIKEGKRVW